MAKKEIRISVEKKVYDQWREEANSLSVPLTSLIKVKIGLINDGRNGNKDIKI